MRYAVWVKCNGEAHKNPFIDHCMVCMPFWENYPLCPDCKLRLTDKGFCRGCHHYFILK